ELVAGPAARRSTLSSMAVVSAVSVWRAIASERSARGRSGRVGAAVRAGSVSSARRTAGAGGASLARRGAGGGVRRSGRVGAETETRGSTRSGTIGGSGGTGAPSSGSGAGGVFVALDRGAGVGAGAGAASSTSSTWIGAAATSKLTSAMAPIAAAWQRSEARSATASPRSSQRLERILETADRADRRAGGEKALDRGAGHAAVRRESTEGLVRLVEHVLEPDEAGQLPPRGRCPQADEGVAGERRLAVRLVAAEELGADPAEVERERRPAPRVIGEARVHPVLGREGEEVSRPHGLGAAEGRGELGALLE